MRAFLAIALPTAVRTSLAALQQTLAESGADVKWVEPDHLHVTLKFLDEISDEQRRQIETLLERVTARQRPFRLSLKAVGAFPSVAAPRIIWVGIDEGREAVIRLAETIEEEGRTMALRREERPFAAHVTIGRVRSSRQRSVLARRLGETDWQPPSPWQATAVHLYQSQLDSAGPRYTVLAEVPLIGS